ncbi:hypothetical protein K3495_g757 [Podosphaera aphanis]|nr:hypothetical protein K3495_g757 [Podosphaera aphanis]
MRIFKRCLKAKGVAYTKDLHTTATELENQAYNVSDSREAYDAACNVPAGERSINNIIEETPEPTSPGIRIGEYLSCHQVSTGFCSQVYRCKNVALKVITHTHNIEPHNPRLEIKMLSDLSHPSIIKLTSNFRDTDSRLVLVFPYCPFTLSTFLSKGTLSKPFVSSTFHDLFSALDYLHTQGIIHRDVKPSNILFASLNGPALLADFGTSWHPIYSLPVEPPTGKQIEVGTSTYRAPETLFGWRAYGTSLDVWATGVMLAECLRDPPAPLFESRETTEDGNQLGLIMSMFQTIGTPTKKTWPEACAFNTPPFGWYREFPAKKWEAILQGADESGIDLVRKLVLWETGSRLTATEALSHPFLRRSMNDS